MCGIAGLFLKDASLQDQCGALVSDMLVILTDRGPDSAGIAIYEETPKSKVTVQSPVPDVDFAGLDKVLSEATSGDVKVDVRDTHAVLLTDAKNVDKVVLALAELRPNIRVMSRGQSVEIFKEVGLPKDVMERFAIDKRKGSHAIGHTRMATESAVTTLGAHPFSTGLDQCLVHNGSLSNHNNLRRELNWYGIETQTMNDTEVAACYLTWRMDEGDSLGEALESCLDKIDGFYNFVVGTKNGFGVLRDPISCKPAIMAETDQYVAFGSEYRALVNLPNIENAKIWEPEPATVYFWEH